MKFQHSTNSKAPLINWDIFTARYNCLMDNAIKFHQSVDNLKKIAKHNNWKKQQLKEAIENINKYVIVVTDNLQNITFTSHSFEIMTGYTFEEVKGKNPKFLQGTKTNKLKIQKINHELSINNDSESILENYRKNGELYLCKIIIKPIISINKKVVNYIAYEQEIAA